MELLPGSGSLPGDPRLVDEIVCELKSQGIFDQFRKECLADVDTKPAYQNLRQRVEGSVAGFLSLQKWKPDINKNQLRDKLRKNIYESGFLEVGVERIVDQVVNPKISSVFFPQVEEVVYKYLGLEVPSKKVDCNDLAASKDVTKKLEICIDLLPNDLDSLSPDSEKSLNKSLETEGINNIETSAMEQAEENMDIDYDDAKDDIKEEFESPPFEPITEKDMFVPDDSMDSQLSGISGLTSQASVKSVNSPEKECPNVNIDCLNQDSQLSQVSSSSRLSIVTNSDADKSPKMKIPDETGVLTPFKFPENSNSDVFENTDTEQSAVIVENTMMNLAIDSNSRQSDDSDAKDMVIVTESSNDTTDSKTRKEESSGKSSEVSNDTVDPMQMYETKENFKMKGDQNESAATDQEIKTDEVIVKVENDNSKSSKKTNDVSEKSRSSKHHKSSRHTSSSRNKSYTHHSSSSSKDRKESSSGSSKYLSSQKSSSSKHSSKENDRKHDRHRKDSSRSEKSSSKNDSRSRDKDTHKKGDVDSEKDKTKSNSSSKSNSKSSRDRYESTSSSKDRSASESKTKDKSDSKEKRKSESDKNKIAENDKTRSSEIDKSKASENDKSKSSESDKQKDRDRRDRKGMSKSEDKRHKTESESSRDKSESRKDKEKSKSSHSRSGSRRDRDRKSESSSKTNSDKNKHRKKVSDDHGDAKYKKPGARRSTDRDSNDGNSNLSNKASSNSVIATTANKKGSSSETGEQSSSNTSNDSTPPSEGHENSSLENNTNKSIENTILRNAQKVLDDAAESEERKKKKMNVVVSSLANGFMNGTLKMRKPKIASNIYEVRKLMKVRRKMEKMERKRLHIEEMEKSKLISQSIENSNVSLMNSSDVVGDANQGLELEFVCTPSAKESVDIQSTTDAVLIPLTKGSQEKCIAAETETKNANNDVNGHVENEDYEKIEDIDDKNVDDENRVIDLSEEVSDSNMEADSDNATNMEDEDFYYFDKLDKTSAYYKDYMDFLDVIKNLENKAKETRNKIRLFNKLVNEEYEALPDKSVISFIPNNLYTTDIDSPNNIYLLKANSSTYCPMLPHDTLEEDTLSIEAADDIDNDVQETILNDHEINQTNAPISKSDNVTINSGSKKGKNNKRSKSSINSVEELENISNDDLNHNNNIKKKRTDDAVVSEQENTVNNLENQASNTSTLASKKKTLGRARRVGLSRPKSQTLKSIADVDENEIKIAAKAKPQRGSVLQTQRYTSEDLYKPRPMFRPRSRRRGLDTDNLSS